MWLHNHLTNTEWGKPDINESGQEQPTNESLRPLDESKSWEGTFINFNNFMDFYNVLIAPLVDENWSLFFFFWHKKSDSLISLMIQTALRYDHFLFFIIFFKFLKCERAYGTPSIYLMSRFRFPRNNNYSLTQFIIIVEIFA